MALSNLFTEHPESVNETYLEHMEMSSSFSFWLFVAGFCALVHAVLPFMFEKTGSKIISKLHSRMVTNRVIRSTPIPGAKNQTVSNV
jgi:Family of unknown function (DUF6356)